MHTCMNSPYTFEMKAKDMARVRVYNIRAGREREREEEKTERRGGIMIKVLICCHTCTGTCQLS